MSRFPNPWITVPAILMGLLSGFLGWVVTDVSCRTDGGTACLGWSALFAAIAFIGAALGVGVVLVLAYRSLAEWRERGGSPPGR